MSKRSRAFEFAARQPWAITEESLGMILEIAKRSHEPDFEAVATRQADAADGLRENFGSVAVINAIGPTFRYASLFTAISGATTVQALASEFRAAVDDPAVSAIILNLDTPGGEVAGTSELASAIFGARGTKPIIAYADDYMASAGYWYGSAADKIVVSPTARIGSIGVRATVTKSDPEPGEKAYEFVSSVSPKKVLGPETKEGAAEIQSAVDDLANVFVADVARNRGIDAKAVLANYGQGGLMVGAKAVAAGMADEVGTFDEVLQSLAGSGMRKNSVASATKSAKAESTKEKEHMENEKKPAELAGTAAPLAPIKTEADIQAMIAQAVATAREQDRALALEIGELCTLAGCPERANEFIGLKATASEVRKTLVNGQAAAAEKAKLNPAPPVPGTDARNKENTSADAPMPWSEAFKKYGVQTNS